MLPAVLALLALTHSVVSESEPVKCINDRQILYQFAPCPAGFQAVAIAGNLSIIAAPIPPAALPKSPATFSSPAKLHVKTPRNPAKVREFRSLHPCPATLEETGPCPGWVVDHINPLACGGVDYYTNMQWQTVADAKAKDRVELRCDR